LYDRIKKRRENSPVIETSESLFREEKGENYLAGNIKKSHYICDKKAAIGPSPPHSSNVQVTFI